MADELPDDEHASEQRRASTTRELLLRAELVQVRDELKALLAELDRVASEPGEPAQSAVVTAVVPKTVLLHIGSVRR